MHLTDSQVFYKIDVWSYINSTGGSDFIMKQTGEYVSINNTKKTEKPNEDFCICDNENGIYIVLDGVSRDNIDGKYPNPSPAVQVTEIFAKSAHKFISDALKHNVENYIALIKDSMLFGNKCIADFNSMGIYSFAPGTVGIVMIVRDTVAYYGFIGDCTCKVVRSDSSTIFTRRQTENVHKYKSLYTADEIRNHICNNIDHPAGYGVLNGASGASDFIELGQFTILEGEKIMLYTDGFEEVIDSRSPNQLYELSLLEAKELSMPTGDEYIDDRTLLIIS